MNPSNFHLWGSLKDKVHEYNVHDNPTKIHKISRLELHGGFQEHTQSYEVDGGHFERRMQKSCTGQLHGGDRRCCRFVCLHQGSSGLVKTSIG